MNRFYTETSFCYNINKIFKKNVLNAWYGFPGIQRGKPENIAFNTAKLKSPKISSQL